MTRYDRKRLCAIGVALVYCVGVNERENPKSGMEMFQSNIYFYVRMKGYMYNNQTYQTYQDVPRRTRRTKTYQTSQDLPDVPRRTRRTKTIGNLLNNLIGELISKLEIGRQQ